MSGMFFPSRALEQADLIDKSPRACQGLRSVRVRPRMTTLDRDIRHLRPSHRLPNSSHRHRPNSISPLLPHKTSPHLLNNTCRSRPLHLRPLQEDPRRQLRSR